MAPNKHALPDASMFRLPMLPGLLSSVVVVASCD